MNIYIYYDIKFNCWWFYFKMYEIFMFFVQFVFMMFRVVCCGCYYRFIEIKYLSISEFYKC